MILPNYKITIETRTPLMSQRHEPASHCSLFRAGSGTAQDLGHGRRNHNVVFKINIVLSEIITAFSCKINS